jgi:hypothetical protein
MKVRPASSMGGAAGVAWLRSARVGPRPVSGTSERSRAGPRRDTAAQRHPC